MLSFLSGHVVCRDSSRYIYNVKNQNFIFGFNNFRDILGINQAIGMHSVFIFTVKYLIQLSLELFLFRN